MTFRDALRSDEEVRSEYLKLKRHLADRHRDDVVAYTLAKGAFVESVVLRFPSAR